MTLSRALGVCAALAGFVALAAACHDFAATLREGTYGPSFEYISKEQLQSTMWQLARDTRDLERVFAKPGEVSEPDRQQVLALLAALSEETEKLGQENARTNHPLLDERRDQFRADIEEARRGVLATPPSYTLARTVSGACVRCHDRSMH